MASEYPEGKHKESQEDRESRLLLINFLQTTDSYLEAMLSRMEQRASFLSDLFMVRVQQLRIIWSDARANLGTVIQSLGIGLNRRTRDALRRVGMMGVSLKAKLALLRLDIDGGLFRSVLSRLNSLLGSLAQIYISIDAVKELKEQVEATLDFLKDPEIIQLNLNKLQA